MEKFIMNDENVNKEFKELVKPLIEFLNKPEFAPCPKIVITPDRADIYQKSYSTGDIIVRRGNSPKCPECGTHYPNGLPECSFCGCKKAKRI